METTIANPWDQACQRRLKRTDPITGREILLDPGVTFFVEMLERFGAKTLSSAEGNPRGFYITFRAPLDLARRIARYGCFTVEVGTGDYDYTMRKNEAGYEENIGPWTEEARQECLRLTALAWVKEFHQR